MGKVSAASIGAAKAAVCNNAAAAKAHALGRTKVNFVFMGKIKQEYALRRGYPAAGSIRQCEKRTIALLAGIQAGGISLDRLPKLQELSGLRIQRTNV